MIFVVHNVKGIKKSNLITVEIRYTTDKDENAKIVPISFEMQVDMNLKEFLEKELKKIFPEPIQKIKYLQKAESTLFKLYDKINRRVVDRAELEEELEDLKEDKNYAIDNFNSTHRGDPEVEYDMDAYDMEAYMDEYEDDVLDELDDDEREEMENEREELEGYIEEIRNIDWQIKEIEKRLKEPEDFEIGNVDTKYSEASEIIVDTILRTVPVHAISSFFDMFLYSSDLSYDYDFKSFMIPLSLEFANYDKDEETLDFSITEECYQLLRDILQEMYMAIPCNEDGDEIKEEK